MFSFKKKKKRGRQIRLQKYAPAVAGTLTLSPSTDLVFSGWIFAVWLSVPTSAGMNVLGGVGPWPQPLSPNRAPNALLPQAPVGAPPFPPHIVVKSFKKKKKSTSPFPGVKENIYLKARWLSGPVLYHWTLLLQGGQRLSHQGRASQELQR